MDPARPRFEDFLDPQKWKDLESHLRTSSQELEQNISATVESEKSIRTKSRKYLEDNFLIKKVSQDQLQKAEDLLFGSMVCASDGTYATVDLSTTGIKGQIGIVTTSYVNKRTDYVSYFFEPLVTISEKEFTDVLTARRKMSESEGISSSHIKSIMLFMERQKILEREEPWKLVNGDIFPYELRTGQGRLRGLKACLDLGRRILNCPTFIGVTANSKDRVLNTLGRGLNAMEYVDIKSYKDEIDHFLENAHFNESDMAMSQEFAKTYGNNFRVGLYKIARRPYIFFAHRDKFDDAASIVMRDSLFQPTRGYPLLIDYADSICTRLVAASDFKKQVNYKLAKHGALEEEADEHSLRRR